MSVLAIRRLLPLTMRRALFRIQRIGGAVWRRRRSNFGEHAIPSEKRLHATAIGNGEAMPRCAP